MSKQNQPPPYQQQSVAQSPTQQPMSTHATTHRFASEKFEACVFVGGSPPHPFVAPVARKCHTIAAADSGWRHALSIDIMPTIVLGDFDSISASELQDARAAQVPLVEYPSDKDVTDAEIALQYVIDEKCKSLLLISGGGDRLDHLLSLLHALCNESLEGLRRCAVIGDTRIDIVTPVWPLDLSVDFGQLVSLVPLTQDAIGVSATGLRWVLQHDTLRVAESRGVSNVTNEGRITVSVENGCIAVMQPHYFPQHKEPAS